MLTTMSCRLFVREFENECTFFVLKTEVPIQENIGLMLSAFSHSILSFTVHNGLHFFLGMYKAFLLTHYLIVTTPESS